MEEQYLEDRIKTFIKLQEDFYCKGLTFNFRNDKIIISCKFCTRIIDYSKNLFELSEILANKYVTENILAHFVKDYKPEISGNFAAYLKNRLILARVIL